METFSFISLFFWFAIAGIFVGQWGKKREIGFWAAFFITFFLSPIVGVIAVAVSKKKEKIEPLSVRYYNEAQRHVFKEEYAEALGKYQDAYFDIQNREMPETHRTNQSELIQSKMAWVREQLDKSKVKNSLADSR